MNPVLFVMSGLPASGKSTLAKFLSKEYDAFYLRIDTVEQALRDLCGLDVQGEGYRLSYRIAKDNLALNHNVVADSCNPVDLTRKEWEAVAVESNCRCINVEVVCSDKAEHRRRCETRSEEVTGLHLPSWNEIINRKYDVWERDRILIDTAGKSPEDSSSDLKKALDNYLESDNSGSIR